MLAISVTYCAALHISVLALVQGMVTSATFHTLTKRRKRNGAKRNSVGFISLATAVMRAILSISVNSARRGRIRIAVASMSAVPAETLSVKRAAAWKIVKFVCAITATSAGAWRFAEGVRCPFAQGVSVRKTANFV
jgi:hypothetical protein